MSTEGISCSIKGLEKVRAFPLEKATIGKIIAVALVALAIIAGASLLYHYGHLLSASIEAQTIASGIIGLLGVSLGVCGVAFYLYSESPDYAERAMRSHLLEAIERKNRAVSLKELDLSLHPTTISCIANKAEAKGKREKMEDKTFIVEDDSSLLAAIFDGHGDAKAAKYAATRFPPLFREFRAKYEIPKAFEKTIVAIHDELLRSRGVFKRLYLANLQNLSDEEAYKATLGQNKGLREKLTCGGTTACVCFIDKQSGTIYTATLGDSEARVYRKTGDAIYSIPLSVVKNWSDPEEAHRAKEVHFYFDDFSIPLSAREVAENEDRLENKGLYDPMGILNVSRAIGDLDHSAISHKPIVTMHQLLPRDCVVLACDGLWDCFSTDDNFFIKNMLKPNWERPHLLPRQITTTAIHTYKSSDNVSVVVISITEKK